MDPLTSSRPARSSLELVCCPECGVPAEVEWDDVVDSTDGPVHLVKLRCLDRHWFLMELPESER